MLYLYAGIFILVLMSIVFLLSTIFTANASKRATLLLSIVISIISLSLYQFYGDKSGLKFWLQEGQRHYHLQEKFIQLGGMDIIVEKIERKIMANPQDAQGWFILAKLYVAKKEEEKARLAVKQAHKLAPDNKEINAFYEELKEPRA